MYLGESFEDIPDTVEVHLIRAVKHITRQRQGPCKILRRLRLTRPGRPRRRASQHETEGGGECDVAAIGEGGDDEAPRIADPLVGVERAVVADANEDVPVLLDPVKAKLLEPGKGEDPLGLVVDDLLVAVPRVHVERDDGNDLASV